MTTCAGCGAEAGPDQRFCIRCGASLAPACGTCGASLPEGARFCGQCGTPVGREQPPEEAARPTTQERRLVSVLFVDLVGYTSLAESRDPEDVRGFLTEYFDLARDVVQRYGGRVEKFIGDAVMALWGSPVAREDDAERAVRAALDLVTEASALGRRSEIEDLSIRAGLATGEAAVLLEAEGQGMVAGDLVNTASRLQDAADPGTVLVDESTFRSAQDAISFTSKGELDLKGKSESVRVWRAGQVIAKRRGEGRARSLEPPFVGRVGELQLLKDLFRATVREGKAHLVQVSGMAGIGKSRLAWEFEKYLDGLTDVVYWHQGRSPSYGEGITFWALGEMVRRRTGIAETDDRDTTAAKLRTAVEELVPEEDRSWIETHLAALLGLGATEADRDELFAAWRAFFERLAERYPVVMVFEDLQWADQGLLDFIESLLEWSRSHPIFILALARPELTDRRPTWGAGQRRFASLHLEPLADEEMGELLAGLVPGLPDDLARRILERAAGIPLYAVETVRMLIDLGNLVRSDGRYELAREVTELAVPESLHALLAARLDGLEPEDRRLLQHAAVLGQSFTLPALATLEDQEPDKLERRLEEMVRRELLALDADPRSPERGQYGFVQGVLREVAYGTLSRAERRDLHLRVARYLEGLGDDELAGAVVHHYQGARQADPGDPELVELARTALVTAAERASALGSHDQELAYLEQVMDLVEDPEELAGLWEAAARACELGGAFERAEPYLRRALDWYRSQGRKADAARVTAGLGSVLLMSSRVDEAIASLETALSEHQIDEAAPETVTLRAQLARAYAFRNESARALEESERALDAAARADVVPMVAEALVTRGWALEQMGRQWEAVALTEGALALSVRHGLADTEFRARNNLAVFLLWEDPKGILDASLPGMESARKQGDADTLGALAQKAAHASIELGDWTGAERFIEEARRPGISFFARYSLDLTWAWIVAWRGEVEEAQRLIEGLRGEIEASTSPQDQSFFLALSSVVALADERFEEARELALGDRRLWTADTAPRAASVHGLIRLRVAAHAALAGGDAASLEQDLAHLGSSSRRSWERLQTNLVGYRGALVLLQGDLDRALPLLEEAFGRFDELGLVLDRALLQTEVALILGRDHPFGRSAYQEARETWERLGARPFLERLEAG